jgi:hypothetical protein
MRKLFCIIIFIVVQCTVFSKYEKENCLTRKLEVFQEQPGYLFVRYTDCICTPDSMNQFIMKDINKIADSLKIKEIIKIDQLGNKLFDERRYRIQYK